MLVLACIKCYGLVYFSSCKYGHIHQAKGETRATHPTLETNKHDVFAEDLNFTYEVLSAYNFVVRMNEND